jgi:tripartite-type tricarboxylate transporter receptor subunit TctC
MHAISRRRLVMLTAAASLAPVSAFGQAKKPDLAKILVAFPAGGTTDQIARLLAEQLKGDLATTVLVENRPGAAGRLAIQALRQAPADGATLLIQGLGIQSLYPHTIKQLGYDPFGDIVPLSIAAPLDFCLAVGPAVPQAVRTLKDYVSWVRQDPARGNYATPGAGNPLHFMPLLLARTEKLDLNPVHYRGTTAAMPDLIGGQIPAACTPLNDALMFGQGDKLRVLATSGARRNKFTPQVPTFAEQGYAQLVYRDHYAFFVHGATPADIQERLGASVRAALATPRLVSGLNNLFLEATPSTSAEALRIARADYDTWGRIVKDVGYQPE